MKRIKYYLEFEELGRKNRMRHGTIKKKSIRNHENMIQRKKGKQTYEEMMMMVRMK